MISKTGMRGLLLGAVALLLTISAPGGVDAYECDTYDPSGIAWSEEWQEYVCAGSNSSCTECYDPGSGDSCVTSGAYCEPFSETP